MFNRVWADIVPNSSEHRFPENFEWINVFDSADLVAGAIEDTPAGCREPINYRFTSGNLIIWAHTHYLRYAAHRRNVLLGATFRWMLTPNEKFEPSVQMLVPAPPGDHGSPSHRAYVATQCFAFMVVGAAFWPFSAQLILNIFQGIWDRILNVFLPKYVPDGKVTGWFQAHNPFWFLNDWLDRNLSINTEMEHDLGVIGSVWMTIALLIIVCTALRYLIERPMGPRNNSSRARTAVFADADD
jgi:hypothetical protein